MRSIGLLCALGILLSGCGTSAKTTGAPPKSAAELRAAAVANENDRHKSEACIAVIGSLTHLNISPSGQSVANISSAKEHLHELALVSQPNDQYTIGRMTEMLSRVESSIRAFKAGNYAEANGDLTGLVQEQTELTPKVLAICSKSNAPASSAGNEATTSSATVVAEGNVPAAAAALASICVGTGNGSETGSKVKVLVAAYRRDSSREQDRHYLVVAEENLKSGCGSQYAPEVEEVLGK
jgi:uncharacterized protein YceK